MKIRRLCMGNVILIFVLLICQTESKSHDDSDRIFTRRKREIMRTLNSCPDDCLCEVYKNVNKHVDCFNNGLVDIPYNIPGDATKLNASRNEISTIKSGLLENLRDLAVVDFSHNRITQIQTGAFSDLTEMRYLDLSFNKITNISLNDLRQSARELQILNISSTDIREIPELYDIEELYMTKLTHLSMSNNFFTSIPPLRIPTSVKFLDISCLNMRVLKNSALSGLTHLEELILHGCPTPRGKIKSVENKAFATSVKLKYLDLSENDLNSVPNGLPTSLQYLDLSGNKITTIKKSECATERDMQKRLFVNMNDQYDEYGGGHLSSPLGSALSPLDNLSELRLNGNPVASLCMDDFLNMEKLKILNLTGCRLSSFHPHTFVYTRSLQVLDVSRNQMLSFKTDEISMLEELYLQYNLLEKVEGVDRRSLPSLKKADFSGNPWRCSCELEPLLKLLGYSTDIKFINLHAYSVYYTCSVPLKVKGKPLMALDVKTDLTCEEDGSISIWAIAAPASLVGLIIVIVVVIVITTRRDAKQKKKEGVTHDDDEEGGCCFCCCKSRTNDRSSKKISRTMSYGRYDSSNEVVIKQNALMNDAAILCQVSDQKWILNRLVPEVHRYGDLMTQKREIRTAKQKKKLNMNVYTIGQNMKIERLTRCLDTNRKIVLIITHQFVEEESCLFVLNVIREKMIHDPKDSVILLILDAIAWSTMPESLQFLMVDKTFVQYPQDARGRQEFYFWDTVCSHMHSKSLRALIPPKIEDPPVGEEINKDQTEKIALSSISSKLANDLDNFYPARRAGPGTNTGEGLSETRVARLKRLGLQSDGQVLEDIYAGIAEARNLGREQKKNYEIHNLSQMEPAHYPMQHTESLRRAAKEREEILSVHKDIDDLYSSRGSLAIPTQRYSSSGRVRSLLPPNEGDNDSIYSDEDNSAALQMVRAPERERSVPRANNSNQIINSSQPLDHASNTLRSEMSQEQLHGTNKISHVDEVTTSNTVTGMPSDMIENTAVADPEKVPEESDKGGKKKKKKQKKSKKKKK